MCPTVEAIPKDQYETRLKADIAAMLTEIQLEIEELRLDRPLMSRGHECYGFEDKRPTEIRQECSDIIQEKINELRGNENMSSPCENCGSDIRVCKDCDMHNGKYYTKDEVIEMLTELKDLIDKLPNKRHYITENGVTYGYKDYEPSAKDASQLVQAKINQLRSAE